MDVVPLVTLYVMLHHKLRCSLCVWTTGDAWIAYAQTVLKSGGESEEAKGGGEVRRRKERERRGGRKEGVRDAAEKAVFGWTKGDACLPDLVEMWLCGLARADSPKNSTFMPLRLHGRSRAHPDLSFFIRISNFRGHWNLMNSVADKAFAQRRVTQREPFIGFGSPWWRERSLFVALVHLPEKQVAEFFDEILWRMIMIFSFLHHRIRYLITRCNSFFGRNYLIFSKSTA